MWVVHVERVQGDYREPEIIDLDDGCLFKLHESDISEEGVKPLAHLLTEQAQHWAPRPPNSLGPVIPVRWERIPNPPDPLYIGVDDRPDAVTYTADPDMISQRAADFLGRLETQRSPHWQRVPRGYHDTGKDAE